MNVFGYLTDITFYVHLECGGGLSNSSFVVIAEGKCFDWKTTSVLLKLNCVGRGNLVSFKPVMQLWAVELKHIILKVNSLKRPDEQLMQPREMAFVDPGTVFKLVLPEVYVRSLTFLKAV